VVRAGTTHDCPYSGSNSLISRDDSAVEIAAAAKDLGAKVVVTLHEFHSELTSVRHTIKLVQLADKVLAQDTRNAERCAQHAGRAVDRIIWSPTNMRPRLAANRPRLLARLGL